MKAKQRLFDSVSGLEIALGIMALLSMLVILAPIEDMRRKLSFSPLDYPAILFDDRYSGGDSQVYWDNVETQKWICQMGESKVNPYCSVQLTVLDQNGRGFDLSQFDKMTVWASYSGPAKHVRIYLRNRNAAYYDPANGMTTKYNSIEVPVADLESGLTLNMDDFIVANWWLVHMDIPLELSKPEFGDVGIIELQTGSQVRDGTHAIQLHKIEWNGPFVSKIQLYQWIIGFWSVAIFTLLAYRVIRLKIELRAQESRREELLAINQLLNLKTKRFEDLAKTDPLTGVWNRLGIRDVLHQGLGDWRRNQTPFSLIIIDIDNFKQINDTFGHESGDEVLKQVARIFSQNTRQSDVLARWGGEEFVLVCPNTTLEQAATAAEILRKKLESTTANQRVKVTASFGVATMMQPDLDHMFKRADEALYRAKRQGRNCVLSDTRKIA